MKYDVIFWSHGVNETDRYLPLMVELKRRGVKALLFFQNYNAEDFLYAYQMRIINKNGLDIKDYSYVYGNDCVLNVITFFSKIIHLRTFRNKLIGLRSKILMRKIRREDVMFLLRGFNHKINIFDFISITSTTNYPYGSFYVLDVSKEIGIKNFAIPHGIASYIADHLYPKGNKLSYDKIFVADERYKESLENGRIEDHSEVIVLGDPRFDSKWKKFLSSGMVEDGIKTSHQKNYYDAKFRVLYLCPNLEQIGFESFKYDNLKDVAKTLKNINNSFLLIKPHPRYRHEKLIKKTMREAGLKDFEIITDDPIIQYDDQVDLVVSSATSAFFDFMPENHEKVLVYDNFMKKEGLENLFLGHVKSCSDYHELAKYLAERLSNKKSNNYFDKKQHDIDVVNFCSDMVAGGDSLEEIVNNYCNYFSQELEDKSEHKIKVKK